MLSTPSHFAPCPPADVLERVVEDLCDFVQARCEASSRWFGKGRFARHAPPHDEPITAFHSGAVPPSPLFDLARAMFASGACSAESLIVGFVLMGRYELMSGTAVTAHMMHRLYVTCVQVGLKLHSDFFFNNAQFGAIVGVSLHELNRLEAALLDGISWSVWVDASTVASACDNFHSLFPSPPSAIVAQPPAPQFQPPMLMPQFVQQPAYAYAASSLRSDDLISPTAAYVCSHARPLASTSGSFHGCLPAQPTPYFGPAEPTSPPTLSLCCDEDESDAYERAALLRPEQSPSTTPVPVSCSYVRSAHRNTHHGQWH